MPSGTVMRFNKIKGYGFIKPDEGDDEIFVHFSAIQQSGYKELQAGQRIKFELNHGERGAFASNVALI